MSPTTESPFVLPSHDSGGGPRFLLTDLTTNHPNAPFPAAPTATPMSIGICLSRTSTPCFVQYFVMNRGPATAIPRIVFTYLDYLLVEEMNQWDFTFSYRTSIEHFSPDTEDVEHRSEAYRLRDRSLLDWLGNLALVTVSANSKFSNYLPAQKANNHAARRQSLKLELMARRAETGSWNDEDVKAHHKEIVGLLNRALERL